jgi:hypothetical protein
MPVALGGCMMMIEHMTDGVLDAVRGVPNGMPDTGRDRVGQQRRDDAKRGNRHRQAGATALALRRGRACAEW